MPPGAHRNSPSQFLALLISFWIAAIVVTLFLAGWVTQRTMVQHKSFFSTAPLGGQFTQLQAKAIDFVSGAVVAPLFMAGATFCWFYVSRTIAFNERGEEQQTVSLQALVQIATTETGSFNISKLRTLANTRRPRFILFGVLVLLAAVSSTLMANVIAYEAYYGTPKLRNVVMQRLNYNWKLTRDDFEPNVHLMNLFNTLGYQNASTLLDKDGAWTRPNLTDASIAKLDSSVVELRDVPAYRQSITCEPAVMDEFKLSKADSIREYLTVNVKIGDENFQTYVWGSMFDPANDDPTEFYNFAAYNYQGDGWVMYTTKVLLVTATRRANKFKTPHNGSSPSEFGNLPHISFDPGFGSKVPDCPDPFEHGCPDGKPVDPSGGEMEAWGVVCQIHFQFGTVDMARPSTSIWSVSRASFPDPPVWYYSWLPTLEPLLGPFYHSPISFLGGAGSPLAKSATYESNPCTNCCVNCLNPHSRPVVNFTTFAMNYLYADASLLSNILNYDMCPTCRHDNSSDVVVDAGVDDCAVIVYRITYISGLLVLALVVFAAAAAIPLGMMMCSLDMVALRQWRVVDALRMVVDVVQALGPTMEQERGDWSKAKLGKWADAVMLGYCVVQGQTRDRIELNVEENEGRNWDTGRRWGNDEREHGECGDDASQHLLEVLDENDAAQ